MISPMMGGVIVASFVGGRLVSRTGRYKLLYARSAGGDPVLRDAGLGGPSRWGPADRGHPGGHGPGDRFVMPNLTTAIQNAVERAIWAGPRRRLRFSARSAARSGLRCPAPS